MSWSEEKAKERVDALAAEDFEVTVIDLTKEMDFHNLGLKEVRRAQGAHIYVDVPNFHLAVSDAGEDKQKQRKLLRAASVLRKIQLELLSDADVADIQLQAVRLHCFAYKPYEDEAGRATKALTTAITLTSYVYEAFNSVFSEVRNFETSVGISSGQSLIANIGYRGDRELISLGSCANLGAKVINGRKTITVTGELYKVLPDCLKKHFVKSKEVSGHETFQATGLLWSDHPELAKELGIKFDAEKLKKRTEQYRDELPLSEMEITGAETLISPDVLTERNSKRVSAVSTFVDIDGFTAAVDEAEKNEDVASLLRSLHMIRSELQNVLENDFPGLVLQHRGDCIVAIAHMPPGEDELSKRAIKGLKGAIGCQSSMEHALNAHLPQDGKIHISIGQAIGTVLVTRLGKKGEREIVCLGEVVVDAEELQRKSSAKEIRISQELFDLIPENELVLRAQFKEDKGSRLAKDLTFTSLDELEAEDASNRGALKASVISGGIRIGRGEGPVRDHVNAEPWTSKAQ